MASPRTVHAQRLFAGLPGTYDRMGTLLSFGQDPRWRRFLVSRLARATPLVLDVATGTAAVAIELATSGRARAVIGLDQSDPMLREGVRRAAGFRPPAAFVQARAERPPFTPATFDGLTVTYLLRYVDDPPATLVALASMLRPGGVLASLEFAVPTNPLARACWRLYTRTVMPAVGRVVSRDWERVGSFLGPSIESFWARFPLEAQREAWRDAGLERIRWRTMSNGAAIVMWGVRAG